MTWAVAPRARAGARAIPFVIALTAAAIFTFRPTYDPDLFYHLAHGEHDVQVGLVRTNVFNPTFAAYPQHYTTWAFDVVQAGLERSLTVLGIQFFQWGFLTAAFAMLYASARTKGSRAAALAVLLLALFVIEPRAMPRPYLVSFVGFASCSWFINRQRFSIANSQWTIADWLLPIAIGIWSNFHSESVFGLALVVLLWKLHGASWPFMVKGLVLCVLATFATPYGWGLWRYLYENVSVPSVLRIAELEPPSLSAYPAFFAFLLVLVVALASLPRRLKAAEVAIVAVFGALGLRYIRFTPMVVFAAAPMLADRIQAWIDRGWDRRAVLATAVAVMVVTAPASPQRMIGAWRTGDAALAPPEYFSEGAVAFIRANGITAPMFNSLNLGGFLDWKLGGQTFVDSRLQAVPPEFLVALTDASGDPEKWRALVKNVNWAVLSLARPNDISGVGKFNAPEWFPVFQDRAVEILARRNAETLKPTSH
jgi:hypothetical protein